MPKCISILGVDYMGILQCWKGGVEMYGLAKRSKFDLALMLETKLKLGIACCVICYQTKRTGLIMICAVKGQRAYMIDDLKAGIIL